MRVRYTETALAEVEQIFAYIREHNAAAAARVVAAIETTVERLREHPRSAHESDEADVRMTPVGRYPYLIFYRLDRDELQIVRVLHGARSRPWEEHE